MLVMNKILFFLLSLFTILILSACASTDDEDEPNEGGLPTIHYLALGASDATGIGALPLTRGYVFRIKDGLEDRGRNVKLVNLGIPTANVPAIEKTALAAIAADTKKDLVTIWTGANDVIGGDDVVSFEKSLENILQNLRKDPAAFIVLMNLPDLTQIKRFREDPDKHVTPQRVAAFNQAITRQAQKYNVPLVDFFKDSPGDMLVSKVDGFHPNNDGHQRIADLYLQIILPHFGL